MLASPRVAPVGLAVALACAAPSPASAQSVLVLVHGDDGGAAVRAAAVEAIAQRGVRLVRTPDGAPCEDTACAAALVAQTGADHALLFEARSPEELALTAVSPERSPETFAQPIVDGDLASAAALAVERFLAHARAAPGFVFVDSLPAGAAVEIDGAAAGPAPLRRSASPGPHRVAVTRGADRRERTVEVIAGEETTARFDFEAEAQAAAEPPAPPPETRSAPSPFNWVLGGALAVGGVIALVSPLQTLAQDGQCTERVENVGCLERVHIGAQTGILLGVGVAGLIAAVIVDAVAPIRMDVAVGSDGAALNVAGRF